MLIQTSINELTKNRIIEEYDQDDFEGVKYYSVTNGHLLLCSVGSHDLNEIVDFINVYDDGVVLVIGQYHERQFNKGVKLELRIFQERTAESLVF